MNPIRNAYRFFRTGNWLYSKIPPLVLIAYAEILLFGIPAHIGVRALGITLFSAGALAAFGHLLNDTFDIEIDRRAGKEREVARIMPRTRWAILSGLAVGGAIPWLFLPLDRIEMALLSLIYVLPFLYSVPPIRLKERGLLAVVADAAYTVVVPTMFVARLFSGLGTSPSGDRRLLLTGALLTWSIAVGIRAMLRHLTWDRENDLRSGIRTFLTERNPDSVGPFVRRVVFPVEALAFVGLLALTFSELPLLTLTSLAFLAWDLAGNAADPRRTFDPAPPRRECRVALVELYEVWLPTALAIALPLQSISYIPIAILHLVLFHVPIRISILDGVKSLERAGKS